MQILCMHNIMHTCGFVSGWDVVNITNYISFCDKLLYHWVAILLHFGGIIIHACVLVMFLMLTILLYNITV